MQSYVKRFFSIIGVLLVLLLVDIIVCFRTYYVPSLGMFVSYKYIRIDENTPKNVLSAAKTYKAHNLPDWDVENVRINFFTRSLLAARLAHGFPPKIDWLVMAPPSEIGCSYIINKQTKTINICENAFGSYRVFINNSVRIPVINEPISADLLYEKDVNSIPREKILEPYIVINNSHWLLAHYFGAIPENGIRKAHLWHLFVVKCN